MSKTMIAINNHQEYNHTGHFRLVCSTGLCGGTYDVHLAPHGDNN